MPSTHDLEAMSSTHDLEVGLVSGSVITKQVSELDVSAGALVGYIGGDVAWAIAAGQWTFADTDPVDRNESHDYPKAVAGAALRAKWAAELDRRVADLREREKRLDDRQELFRSRLIMLEDAVIRATAGMPLTSEQVTKLAKAARASVTDDVTYKE